ncbi:MAG: flagellar type III secretion system pore protein FliP [Deltaproteobacteria bacterium]|nr:flagellar type III secretion system pore protein FliP [Deltaproteobacteria bacterium]
MKVGIRRFPRSAALWLALLPLALWLVPSVVFGQDGSFPDLSISIGDSKLSSDGNISAGIKIVALLSALTFAPALVLTTTCFTRIAVVLGMTRTALGTQSLPPNMVITGLALFMTFAIMGPVYQQMYDDGVKPYLDGQMAGEQALEKTFAPMRTFLVHHSREKDLALFLDITRSEVPEDLDKVPFKAAVPAFVVSELNTAFQIGFLIALPFLVLDMVVSSVLTSMSMITLPPVVISLPLKLMLFVIVDGWHLIISSLVQTYKIG